MTGCPMAYPYNCQACAFYGNCPPSQAVQKLDQLQTQFDELKRLLEQISQAGK